ncbi:MAG: hypothetical protein WA110_07525, partial [Anaerolineaceae bacterium]
IREAAGPETSLLGCGCPLGSALGIVDLMRISEDVSPTWEPEFYGVSTPFKHEPGMPGARNAIQNILARSEMDHYWWGNDPDCLLVRPDSRLTLAEVQSLATVIGITGGAMLISDDLTKLPLERLRIAQNLIPVISSNPQVLDRFERTLPCRVKHVLTNAAGEYTLLAAFNWQDQPISLRIDLDEWKLPSEQTWLAREFWSGKILSISREIILEQVPAHGVSLLAVHPLSDKPVYLGGDWHFSQGIELKFWDLGADELRFSLDLGRQVRGKGYLYSPVTPLEILQDEVTVPWVSRNGNILEIPLELSQETRIRICYP